MAALLRSEIAEEAAEDKTELTLSVMMKSIYIVSAILLLGNIAFAQNEEDIVRYSVTTNTGSARSSAMGGAFGALGGDMTTLGNNPA